LHGPQVERVFAVKLAVATFGERVSPRFDCAQTFLVVTVNERGFSDHQYVYTSGWGPHERVNHLVALGVQAVVCGGIDVRSAEWLHSLGVKVFARKTGSIEEVLAGLFEELSPTELATANPRPGSPEANGETAEGRAGGPILSLREVGQ
jgi:predicted Fe-Mo cluster-binding NifX family protein